VGNLLFALTENLLAICSWNRILKEQVLPHHCSHRRLCSRIIAAIDVCADAGRADAYDQGILPIAAAGNSGDSMYCYPASYSTVVSVAAVDPFFVRAGFSTHNDQVELSAPEVAILSTEPEDQYQVMNGTSMASPHVVGVAALVWSHFPSCTNTPIRNVLVETARQLGENDCGTFYGHGIVQAKATYDLLCTDGCEAGGTENSLLIAGAVGGCEQASNTTLSPTASPTTF
jgi:hypothetical protein